MANTFVLRTERLAWHERGFRAGFYDEERKPPAEEPWRGVYLRSYRTGVRERLRKEAEGDMPT